MSNYTTSCRVNLPVEAANIKVPIRDRAMVALEQDRAGPVGAVEARPGSPLAEITDLLAVFPAQLDPEGLGLVGVLLVQAIKGPTVGLAVAHVHVLVGRLAVPDQVQLLACHRIVIRLPLAGGPGIVFAGSYSFVKRAAIVKRELGNTVAIEDLDLEQALLYTPELLPYAARFRELLTASRSRSWFLLFSYECPAGRTSYSWAGARNPAHQRRVAARAGCSETGPGRWGRCAGCHASERCRRCTARSGPVARGWGCCPRESARNSRERVGRRPRGWPLPDSTPPAPACRSREGIPRYRRSPSTSSGDTDRDRCGESL